MGASSTSRLIPSAVPSRSPLPFFFLVFALSVPFWVAGAIAGRLGFRPELPMNLPVSSLMAICPLVAAVILIFRVQGFDGVVRLFARAVDYRSIRRKRWYALIVRLGVGNLASRSTRAGHSQPSMDHLEGSGNLVGTIPDRLDLQQRRQECLCCGGLPCRQQLRFFAVRRPEFALLRGRRRSVCRYHGCNRGDPVTGTRSTGQLMSSVTNL